MSLVEKAEQVTNTIVCHHPGRRYSVSVEQSIQFIHMDSTGVLRGGTTNEELLQVLIHRTKQLDSEVPCDENKEALTFMEAALITFQERDNRLGVRTLSKPEEVQG